MTLNRALDKYLKTVSIHKKGHLQEFYRVNVIKRHPMAERYMDEITTVDIATYRDQRLAQINPRTGRQITGNTVRLELALLSSLFNIARVEWGTCRMNPVELVRKPKISSGRDRRLTSGEERRLSRYFRDKNQQLHVIFHLALETAMRQGEILTLRWEHLDLQHGVAHLPETKNVGIQISDHILIPKFDALIHRIHRNTCHHPFVYGAKIKVEAVPLTVFHARSQHIETKLIAAFHKLICLHDKQLLRQQTTFIGKSLTRTIHVLHRLANQEFIFR